MNLKKTILFTLSSFPISAYSQSSRPLPLPHSTTTSDEVITCPAKETTKLGLDLKIFLNLFKIADRIEEAHSIENGTNCGSSGGTL